MHLFGGGVFDWSKTDSGSYLLCAHFGFTWLSSDSCLNLKYRNFDVAVS